MKTIIINNLEWQLDDDGIKRNWEDSINHATTLGDEWRLPTIEELSSIIDYTIHSPACKIESCRPSYYWSSNSDAYYSSYAWYVNFNDGYVGNTDKDNHNYARYVRPVVREDINDENNNY